MHKMTLVVICLVFIVSGSPISAAADLLTCPSDPYEPKPTFESARQVGAGAGLAMYGPAVFSLGGWLAGVILIVFAFAGRAVVLREENHGRNEV